jgi:hypothetical protein
MRYPNTDVNWEAWKALKKTVEKGFVEPVLEALEHDNWDARMGVRAILNEVTKQDFRFDIAKWKKWFEENRGK